MGDGAFDPDDLPALFSSDKVIGDIYPASGDQPGVRLIDTTTGGGWLTTNSDPNVVGVDPLTGEDAPAGTDVGFSAPIRRYFQSGILNGDFSLPPPDEGMPIGDSNPLPFWRWVVVSGTSITATWADGRVRFDIVAPSLTDEAYLEQIIGIAQSDVRAFIYSPAAYWTVNGATILGLTLTAQYLTEDASTTVGTAGEVVATSDKVLRVWPDTDGRVPATARYLRIRIGISDSADAGTYSRLLTEVSADMSAMPAPAGIYGTRARRTANQSISDLTDTSIAFTASDDWDSDELHTSTNQVDIPEGGDGYYLLQGGVEWAADATGYREVFIEINGTGGGGTKLPGSRVRVPAVTGGFATQINTQTIYQANAGDYFALSVRQNSGGALNVTDATFTVTRLAGG